MVRSLDGGELRMSYRLPPDDIVRAVDGPSAPTVIPSPDGASLALVEQRGHPPVEWLARPFLRLGGVRVDPARGGQRRTTQLGGISILRVSDGSTLRLELPEGGLGLPVWSRDSARLAVSVDVPDGIELWVADARTGRARAITGVRLNDVLSGASPLGGGSLPLPAFSWSRDSRFLHARMVPASRAAAPRGGRGPRIEEVAGKHTQMATFQDLLQSEHDEALFEHFATSQLARIDADSGSVEPLGEPVMLLRSSASPDGRYQLVERLERPFSYRVPCALFARKLEIWSAAGDLLRGVAHLPVSDEVPRQGVPAGPRMLAWQEKREASLIWVEALDGGDPMRKVEHRDRVLRLHAPFEDEPEESFRVQHRSLVLQWFDAQDQLLLYEHDRDRRWLSVSRIDLREPHARKVLWDLSVNDIYGNPGRPVLDRKPDGEQVILQDGDAIYLNAPGASTEGLRPYLARRELASGASQRLWQSAEDALESFVMFRGDGRERILIARQSPREPSNLYEVELATGERRALTRIPDPHPQLTGSSKQLVHYTRDDGVRLSATLHLPAGHVPGTRLPLLIWAYPMDYGDAGTAGQVRASDKSFTRLQGDSPLWFLLRGWAVLMDASMPVIGDPETKNDSFVEQVVASARAALDALDALGVADRSRAVIAGHSYGAFMTATLLAHSELFAAGIARSGAYNRSLTPFGFQTERRSYWEVPEVYHRVSPFRHADRIKRPLLLIHGEEDSNAGTFPIQSERLFHAIQGHGGTARLVVLPHEGHGYRARETVLHVVAEMLDWAERWTRR
jgi:dipeptidyl aminopeptidase/acylaminoacyl peptidase